MKNEEMKVRFLKTIVHAGRPKNTSSLHFFM